MAGVERLQQGERRGPAQGRAAQRPAHPDPALRGVRGDDRRRHPPPAGPGRDRGRLRRAARVVVGHADVGVVDELLDDDRPRGGDRLQPVHRQPLPRGTGRGQGRDRRDREHDVDGGQGGVPLGADGRAVPRCGVPRAGDGVPLDGAGHDPVGGRRRPRGVDAAPRRAGGAGRQGARHPGQEGPRHRGREPVGPLDRTRAAPAGGGPRHRRGRARRAGAPRRGHAPRDARRPRGRHRPHQPRRLRPAGEGLRARRRRARLRHRPRRRRRRGREDRGGGPQRGRRAAS